MLAQEDTAVGASRLAAPRGRRRRVRPGSVSFGWAVEGEDGESAIELYRAADARMYAHERARRSGVAGRASEPRARLGFCPLARGAPERGERRLLLAGRGLEARLPAREHRIVLEQEPDGMSIPGLRLAIATACVGLAGLPRPGDAEEGVGSIPSAAVLRDPQARGPVEPPELGLEHVDVAERDRGRRRGTRRGLEGVARIRVVGPGVEAASRPP